MASVFKPAGSDKYVIMWMDETGRRRKRVAYHDKRDSDRLAMRLEERADKIRDGTIDQKAEQYRDHNMLPLADHLTAWAKSMESKGSTPKHVETARNRVRRLVAIILGATLSEIEPSRRNLPDEVRRAMDALTKWTTKARLTDLTTERVQKALSVLKSEGRSLETCNHYRAAIMSFAAWCDETHRTRENILRGVKGFNAKEDRRHDRRTVSLVELRRLIDATQRGSEYMGLTGPGRALCYRLAVATGLRYSEIASILPESFNWEAPSITVPACYTKNRETATLPIPDELVNDLAAYVAPLPSGKPIFQLEMSRGARMLRHDLKAADIPYRDAAGLVFDFHALRCEMATLADAAGVSPRVVQKMMRHSSLELTGRYTRPRAVDIEAAAERLPSLKTEAPAPEAMAMTGTDPGPILLLATVENVDECKSNGGNGLTETDQRCPPPPPPWPPPPNPPIPPRKPPPYPPIPPPRNPLPIPPPPIVEPPCMPP
jgi:integrase